jgi:hypothetical protein
MVEPQRPAKRGSFVVWMCRDAEYTRHEKILSHELRATSLSTQF